MSIAFSSESLRTSSREAVIMFGVESFNHLDVTLIIPIRRFSTNIVRIQQILNYVDLC